MVSIIKKLSLTVPVLLLAFTTIVSVPVFAQHGADDTADTTASIMSTDSDEAEHTTSTETTHGGSGSSGKSKVVTTSTKIESSMETENETEVHSKGRAMVAELKQEHKSTKSAEAKSKACENRKKGLENKFSHITTNATKLESKIGNFQTRATTYKTNNNVTVENWDTLVQTATAAKDKVDASLVVLKGVTPTVDCASPTVAEDIATFKAAAGNVRDDLKAYKSAVMKLFVALQNAKGDNKTTTEGSDQ